MQNWKSAELVAKGDGSELPAKVSSAPVVDERYLVPALTRGLDVLRLLSGRERRMTLSAIAKEIGVTRSSAYRLVYTLTHLGFVGFDEADKTYVLGPQVLQLGYGFLSGRDLVEVAMPHLIRLRDRTGWSAHLGELFGHDVIYLARVATRRSVASTIHVGVQLPARSTTMGRVLLAQKSEAALRDLFQDALSSGDIGTLCERLAGDRDRGVVIQNSVFEPGVASVAAPIRDMTGSVVAAVNISVISLLTTEAELAGSLAAEVIAAADAISRELGFRHYDPQRRTRSA